MAKGRARDLKATPSMSRGWDRSERRTLAKKSRRQGQAQAREGIEEAR